MLRRNDVSAYLIVYRKYLRANKSLVIKNKIQSYVLDSYSWFHQYFLQLIMGFMYYIKPSGFTVFSPLKIYDTMSVHKTQFNWFRKLHILLSGYSYFNSYIKIEFEEESNEVNDKKNN